MADQRGDKIYSLTSEKREREMIKKHVVDFFYLAVSHMAEVCCKLRRLFALP